ncbi:hypothetical protein D3C71_1819710 [compost metagenome]
MPKYASASVATKNTAASTAVVRDKKLALPLAPNKLPELPLPNAAPMSAPLPCWIRIKPIIASAVNICTANTTFTIAFILCSLLIEYFLAQPQWAAAMICRKSGAFSDAPPTSPPSMSGCASNCAALPAFMLPP